MSQKNLAWSFATHYIFSVSSSLFQKKFKKIQKKNQKIFKKFSKNFQFFFSKFSKKIQFFFKKFSKIFIWLLTLYLTCILISVVCVVCVCVLCMCVLWPHLIPTSHTWKCLIMFIKIPPFQKKFKFKKFHLASYFYVS